MAGVRYAVQTGFAKIASVRQGLAQWSVTMSDAVLIVLNDFVACAQALWLLPFEMSASPAIAKPDRGFAPHQGLHQADQRHDATIFLPLRRHLEAQSSDPY